MPCAQDGSGEVSGLSGEVEDQMTREIWKPIFGFEEFYEVSNQGRIRSLARISTFSNRWGGVNHRQVPGRLMPPAANTAGYLHITLRANTKDTTFLVHRLVAAAFIANPSGFKTVNHKNGRKSDNAAANLEWMNQAENNLHARTTLPFKQHRHPVKAIRADGSSLLFPSKISAEKQLLGKATGLISWAIKSGKPALGMTWVVL